MLDHVEMRIEFPPHTLNVNQGFGQKHQVGLEFDMIGSDDLDELQQHVPHLDLLQGQLVVALDKFGDIPPQCAGLVRVTSLPGKIQQLADPVHIPSDYGEEEIHQVIFQPGIEAADHAEIKQADNVFRKDEHVPRMGVGMEKTVDKDHFQEGIRPPSGYQYPVESGLIQGGKV